jgi:hypothetical protein
MLSWLLKGYPELEDYGCSKGDLIKKGTSLFVSLAAEEGFSFPVIKNLLLMQRVT